MLCCYLKYINDTTSAKQSTGYNLYSNNTNSRVSLVVAYISLILYRNKQFMFLFLVTIRNIKKY